MLITHGLVATMTEPNRIIEDGAILVRGSQIVDIGPTQELLSRHAGALSGDEVLDARGKLVLPGNICAHTHFYSAFARGMAVPGNPATNFVEVLERLWWKLDRALDIDAIRF